ncbi:MAG: hypothetical protein Kow0077_22620 [Anaerolineae bacterium]
MPWEERTLMSVRKEFVELAQQEGTNFSALCRRYGISRKTGYKWLRRYQQEGEAGLDERSRRPQRSPRQLSAEQEERIVSERQAHPSWGGRKLRARL